MGARPKPLPLKPASAKPPPAKVQVYLSKPGLGAALAREAGLRRLSLSQAAEAALERGLQGRVETDPDDRLLKLERRLSDHMRLTARDLFMLQELVFIGVRTLISRIPEHHEERDPIYRSQVDLAMEAVIDELSRKVRGGRLQFERLLDDQETDAARPGVDAANDAHRPADRDGQGEA